MLKSCLLWRPNFLLIIILWELKLKTNKQTKKQRKEIAMPGEKCEYLHANDQITYNICKLNLF